MRHRSDDQSVPFSRASLWSEGARAAGLAIQAASVANFETSWAWLLFLAGSAPYVVITRAEVRRTGGSFGESQRVGAALLFSFAVCTLLRRWPIGTWEHPGWLPWLSLGLGAIALLGLLTLHLAGWSAMRRRWLTDPLDASAPAPLSMASLGVFCAAAAAAGIFSIAAPWSVAPLGALLGAYAALAIGHMTQSRACGAIGLTLISIAIATAGQAWFGALHAGVALGAWLPLWLARFWRQQLLDDAPWTTAGRLIEPARGLSQIMSALGLALVMTTGASGVLSAAFATLCMLALGSLLARDALMTGRSLSAHATCAAFMAASVVGAEALSFALGWPIDGPLCVALAAWLIAVRVRVASSPPAASLVAYNSWMTGGALALLALYAAMGGIGATVIVAMGLVLAAAVFLMGARGTASP